MKKNLGNYDRMMRVLFAALIVSMYYGKMISGVNPTLMIAIAVGFMITGSLSFSPLYMTFGVNTKS